MVLGQAKQQQKMKWKHNKTTQQKYTQNKAAILLTDLPLEGIHSSVPVPKKQNQISSTCSTFQRQEEAHT
ncbi:hypothetical protein MTR_4g037295 [Medicago truncatula]|uniref:Uncharacterized protein n=1 Tax=Medicago truncatula TaxID=3880 RepID=A0A072UII3_MEDTR|nr:hypothetical protein MTR_4g037295 [Medicago truncatula]